jgi:hypothetical protein
MTPNPNQLHGLPPGIVPVMGQQRPSAEQIEEVRTVRALQVRTQAVAFALTCAGGKEVGVLAVLDDAREIEAYLTGESAPPST